MQHCFSIDVEGFLEGSFECCSLDPKAVGSPQEQYEVEKNVESILEFLGELKIRATFFTLGSIARRQPRIIREIATAGHELASHSLEHRRLYCLPRAVAKEYIAASRKILEDTAGIQVRGFRAPEFSILANSLDILDLIQEAGYQYDSSIYPISGHDVYGIKGASLEIHQLKNGLWEYPPTTARWMGRTWPALGGGYLRLYPLFLNRAALQQAETRGSPAMLYVHPYELGPVCPWISELSRYRRFRRYFGRERVRERCRILATEFLFTAAEDILVGYEMGRHTVARLA